MSCTDHGLEGPLRVYLLAREDRPGCLELAFKGVGSGRSTTAWRGYPEAGEKTGAIIGRRNERNRGSDRLNHRVSVSIGAALRVLVKEATVRRSHEFVNRT
jgi:hypothetical protein